MGKIDQVVPSVVLPTSDPSESKEGVKADISAVSSSSELQPGDIVKKVRCLTNGDIIKDDGSKCEKT